LVTITFSEAVTNFTNADLTITNGALGAVSSSDGGITWTATFTPTANVDDTTNIITLNNAGVTDVAGNAGTGTAASNNYAVNTSSSYVPINVVDSPLPLPAIERGIQTSAQLIVLAAITTPSAGGPAIFQSALGMPTVDSILASAHGADPFGGPFGDVVSINWNHIAPTTAAYVGNVTGQGGALFSAIPDLGVKTYSNSEFLNFVLPRNTFRIAERESAQVVVEARLTNGQPLPTWLTFDARTGTLQGQPPAGWTGKLDIEIAASDGKGNRAVSVIHFEVKAQRPGRAALDAQFKSAGMSAREFDTRLLDHLDAAVHKRVAARN
jgi:hypothetical protein